MMGKLVEDRLFFAEGQHGHAFNLALKHAAHAGGEDGGIAVGGADQDFIAVGHGDLFKALDELGEEGIGDVFDDDAEDAAAPGDQAARMGVGEVLELIDGLPDPLGQTFADCRRAVDGAGDGGDGDLGECGNGADIRGLRGGVALCFSNHEKVLVPAVLERHRRTSSSEGVGGPERNPIDAGALVRLECESNVTATRGR